MAVTPIDAEATFGGQHKTQTEEDNMVKVQTGDTENSEYNADVVHQVTNAQQEYPEWIILAFAAAVGIAFPSPLSAWAARRQRKGLESEVDYLRAELSAARRPKPKPQLQGEPNG